MSALGNGAKLPYRRASAERSYADRLADRLREQPFCKCGCEAKTPWNPNKGSWRVYIDGHYRQDAPYKSEPWLREQYETHRRTLEDIALECSVNSSTIIKAMRRMGIPRRDRSASRLGRKVGNLNPAWKGGVADWDYSADWNGLARKIRNRDEWTCQLCTERRTRWGKNLHVHHIDGDKLNNDPTNLVSVCAWCHPRGERERLLAPALREIAIKREEVMPTLCLSVAL